MPGKEDLGPVSALLEGELREFVRRNGLVFWLDADDQYSGFIDQLAGVDGLPYDVCGYRGSYLELMLALEPLASRTDAGLLVVHLPGFNEDTVRETPLYELYAAGKRFRKALDTLVTDAASGRVRPEQIEAFKEESELTLERADAWLSALLSDESGVLAAQLRAMTLEAVVDDLLAKQFVARQLAGNEDAVWDQLSRWSGMPASWRTERLERHDEGEPASAEDLAFAVTSWALIVEYVHDLSRAPIDERLTSAARLSPVVVTACRALADRIRDRRPDFYRQVAGDTEGWLGDEVDGAEAKDLGQIDTFWFEESKIFKAALRAVEDGDWPSAHAWAKQRAAGESFWLKDKPSRQNAWELILAAANLGDALELAGPELAATSLSAALDVYVKRGAAVDQTHRILEQRRSALLYPQLPEFPNLRSCLDGMRKRWRAWADSWGRGFSQVCRMNGFLPPAELQQRTLFDKIVRPLAQEPGTTALFLVDALRFEMAQEVLEALGEPAGTNLQLKARYAELPTVTSVGMNALAPVADNGKLTPVLSGTTIRGFSTGSFRVQDPETRRRAMHDRVGGQTCPWLELEDVKRRDPAKLKETVSKAKLLVVHDLQIDNAGEKGVGPAVFDRALQDLRAAWRLLREAGVRKFVITSDHGFLLLDGDDGGPQAHGRKIDPRRRHVLSEVAADHDDEVRVPLADLGYSSAKNGAEGHLMFPESVGTFDIGRRKTSFVHGGNSLQERVIPVLTIVHRVPAGGDTHQYVIKADKDEGLIGMHCVRARVDLTLQDSLFGARKNLELGVRVVDDPGVIVELCQSRPGGWINGSVIKAEIGKDFEVFFRLHGATDRRVQVEIHDTGAEATVESAIVTERFGVTPTSRPELSSAPASEPDTSWLSNIDDEGTQKVFAHLAEHGTVTETEAATMLGGARQARKFARAFEKHAALVPFTIRIDVVAGVKRYVREGGQA